jgi:hypothetical protein
MKALKHPPQPAGTNAIKRILSALGLFGAALCSPAWTAENNPPPIYQAPTPHAPTPVATAPVATPAPPPSAPARLSAAGLEKLVAPIALYPDPLIAVMLPASIYPIEIVQAVRFVQDTNNVAKLEQQPWDANVKAVARIPAVIQKMNDDLSWTIELGSAFRA